MFFCKLKEKVAELDDNIHSLRRGRESELFAYIHHKDLVECEDCGCLLLKKNHDPTGAKLISGNRNDATAPIYHCRRCKTEGAL